jgi:excisionase family DNA binding protein
MTQLEPIQTLSGSQMLTVPELAKLLQKSAKTVRKMARNDAIPGARKVGHDWRFQRAAIAKFLG